MALAVEQVLVAEKVAAQEHTLAPSHRQLAPLIVAVEASFLGDFEQTDLTEAGHALDKRPRAGALVGRSSVAPSLPHSQLACRVPCDPPHGCMLGRNAHFQPIL